MKIFRSINGSAKNIGNIIPEWSVALCLRIALFFVFWHSVQSKLYGFSFLGQHLAFWNVSDTTLMLFEHQYNLPLIPASFAAYLTAFVEFFFSIGLLLGLLSRLSALALLVIVLVVQIFVYPGSWQMHILWAGGLLYILREGAGAVSIDKLTGNS